MSPKRSAAPELVRTPAPDLDPIHDPGPGAAAGRMDALPGDVAAEPLAGPSGGAIRVGTASWTDPTMTARGVFYPDAADSAEERLAYYAGRFPVVEVDATYYALPSVRTAELWVARTPPDFTFDIKAHALMTGQPTETKRLPKELRRASRRARRQASDLRQGPAGRPAGAGLDLVHRGSRSTASGGPARVDPAPVPALVLHQLREPGFHRGGDRAPARGRARRIGRVPERELVQREEHRADASLPW